MVYVLMSIWYMCLCVHLRLPYDCVMIVALLIPACLFYLTRTLGRNRHAICGSPMIVIHTYIQYAPSGARLAEYRSGTRVNSVVYRSEFECIYIYIYTTHDSSKNIRF